MRRVVADWDACEANGICAAVAPDVFEIDDDDQMQILNDEVTDENAERVQRAIDGCPKFALSMDEGAE